MKNDSLTDPRDALILAVDVPTLRVGADLLGRLAAMGFDWPLLLVSGAGEALRGVRRHRPGGLFVCIGRERLDACATLIADVRSVRSNVALVAIASRHDQQIELAARIAGASHYFALDSQDAASMQRALGELPFVASARPARIGPAPPHVSISIAHSRDRPELPAGP